MKKSFIFQTVALVAIVFAIGVCMYSYSQNIQKIEQVEGEQTVSVATYEAKRAALYDAALNLCLEASEGAYVWENHVSEENKIIILTHRVPSLEVLLSAIEQMDYDGCLCDSFDEPLEAYDKAFKEYSKITKIK